MPPSAPSTPPAPRDPVFDIYGSPPGSIFADSALLDWDHAINGCSGPLFLPAVGIFPNKKPPSARQYTTATSDAMIGVSGFPSPLSFSEHSFTSSTGGSSPPGNMLPKESTRRIAKRQMNTLAARRYRQRRLDRMNELEAELEAVKREREEWRVKASKLEGEASALKRLLESQKAKKET